MTQKWKLSPIKLEVMKSCCCFKHLTEYCGAEQSQVQVCWTQGSYNIKYRVQTLWYLDVDRYIIVNLTQSLPFLSALNSSPVLTSLPMPSVWCAKRSHWNTLKPWPTGMHKATSKCMLCHYDSFCAVLEPRKCLFCSQ